MLSASSTKRVGAAVSVWRSLKRRSFIGSSRLQLFIELLHQIDFQIERFLRWHRCAMAGVDRAFFGPKLWPKLKALVAGQLVGVRLPRRPAQTLIKLGEAF